MASSPATRQGLIASLSRGRRDDQFSVTASPSPRRFVPDDNTGSSFQPEFESTQQFDTATQDPLPEDNSVNMAAQLPTYSDSESIELGRGVKRSARNSPIKYGLEEDISENPILNLGNDSLYDLTGTPQLRNTSRKQSEGQHSLRKQASVRRASTVPQADLTKTSDIVQPKARSTSASNRRTLSDLHAKVHAESDSSFLEDARQRPTTSQKEKASRFGKSRLASGEQNIPTRFAAGSGLVRPAEQTPRRAHTAPDATFTGNQTAQSFMLPNLPDITELVSGVRKDGTPVFSKTAKARSRFSSASYARGANNDITEHARLHSIPLPEEEKAIFASLQLLKEKVAQLEMEKSEATKRLEEYASEVIELKAHVQAERRMRRPDSALGSDDDTGVRERWRADKANLQASIKAAADRLERSERKQSVSEIAVKRITQERDNLVTQLGVAFYSNEELKDENEALQNEVELLKGDDRKLREAVAQLQQRNEDMRIQFARVEAKHEEEAGQWAKREAELKKRLQRREETVMEMRGLTRELWDNKKAEKTHEITQQAERENRRRSSGRVERETQNDILDRVEEEIRRARAEAVNKVRAAATKKQAAPPRSRSRSKSQTRTTSLTQRRRTSSAQVPQPADDNETSVIQHEDTQATNIPAVHNADDDSKDITYLSFLDPAELSRLRKKLEEEHRAEKASRQASASRKSSLKDITDKLSNVHDVTDNDLTSASRNVRIQSPRTSDAISYEEPDHTADASMLSTASRRPANRAFEEMTSGFILPDITLGPTTLPDTISHNKENCTYCPEATTATAPATKFFDIPTPIPITDREEIDIDATTATVRPSQPPATALATVLKQLQDEVTHLKLKLRTFQQVYSSHDPALGRRKRKAVKVKIDALLTEIERRSEQIYALYDVLEGQKESAGGAQDGREDEEMEVEETLQSIGIDGEELARMNASANAKRQNGKGMGEKKGIRKTGIAALDELLAESEDELEWEGLSEGSRSEDEGVGSGRRRG